MMILTSSSSSCLLLLALLSLYALVQCLINYRAFRESCDSASVAMFFNLVNSLAAVIGLVYFGWCCATTKGIISSSSSSSAAAY